MNSLAQLGRGAEHCSKADWTTLLALELDDRMAAVAGMRDPLAGLKFPSVEPICVFGYTKRLDEWALVYFWAQDMESLSYSTLQQKGSIIDAIRLGAAMCSVCDRQLGLKEIAQKFADELPNDFFASTMMEDGHLYWFGFEESVFGVLYRTRSDDVKINSESVGSCLVFHYDYFKYRSPVWSSVPISFLNKMCGKDPGALGKVLLEPKCFDPRKDIPAGWFLWPWQRCLVAADNKQADICYQPIDTTSLMFDLRKSTMVLEQLKDQDKGEFSSLIRAVVKTAKDAVFKYGGFFDKETGDGIVAHFCDFQLDNSYSEPASARAFLAAKLILRDVKRHCDQIQPKLKMGVAALGGAIGIHTDQAVWTSDNGLVSALGDSIVMAARLCSEADNFSIFVSNQEFRRLSSLLEPADLESFLQKKFCGKEYNETSQLYGFQWQR
ncbi:MAG: hypothetical protein AAF251_06405 [Pseudomonadota bacterium]